MGQANRSLLGKGTLFSADFLDFLPKNFPTVVVGLVIIVVVTAATAIFLQTELVKAFNRFVITVRWRVHLVLTQIT